MIFKSNGLDYKLHEDDSNKYQIMKAAVPATKMKKTHIIPSNSFLLFLAFSF